MFFGYKKKHEYSRIWGICMFKKEQVLHIIFSFQLA